MLASRSYRQPRNGQLWRRSRMDGSRSGCATEKAVERNFWQVGGAIIPRRPGSRIRRRYCLPATARGVRACPHSIARMSMRSEGGYGDSLLWRQILEDEAFIFGAQVRSNSHLAEDRLGFAGRQIFRRHVTAAAVRLEPLFTFGTFVGRRGSCLSCRLTQPLLRSRVLRRSQKHGEEEDEECRANHRRRLHFDSPGISGNKKR